MLEAMVLSLKEVQPREERLREEQPEGKWAEDLVSHSHEQFACSGQYTAGQATSVLPYAGWGKLAVLKLSSYCSVAFIDEVEDEAVPQIMAVAVGDRLPLEYCAWPFGRCDCGKTVRVIILARLACRLR